MAWEVVAAALGSAAVTAGFAYVVSERNTRALIDRTEREQAGRLDQLKVEQKHQLLSELIQRRLNLRRESLLPLRNSIGKLLSLSGRYRYAADTIFYREIGEEVDIVGDIDKEFREAGYEVWRFRREELRPAMSFAANLPLRWTHLLGQVTG